VATKAGSTAHLAVAGAGAVNGAVSGSDGWAHPGGRQLDCAAGSHAIGLRAVDRCWLLPGLPPGFLRMSRAYPAALLLPSDAFDTSSHQVMGRRVAGRAFARGITTSLQPGEELSIVVGSREDAAGLQTLLQPVLPQGSGLKLSKNLNPERLGEAGCLHLPDPGLARWSRLRAGVPSHHFSITGVTHTLCSNAVLEGLEQLLQAPLEPWDALVCTSRAAHGVVNQVLECQREVLERRLNTRFVLPKGPQLPIIPLALDPEPFDWRGQCNSRSEQRLQARQMLGIATDAVVILYVGRLSFHSKAHPISLYRTINELNQDDKLILLECGHIFNDAIEAALDDLAKHFSNLNIKRLGGREPASEEQKKLALAAADIFCSPSDNLQETFGLSLLEAMASQLPVVASDWSGYRDLVEDGITGVLVPTQCSLENSLQQDPLETNFKLGLLDYDSWVGIRSLSTCLDERALNNALSDLIMSSEKRQSMGKEGRNRLIKSFSWPVVSQQYRELWLGLASMRQSVELEGGSNIWPVTSYQRVFKGFNSQQHQDNVYYEVRSQELPLLQLEMHQAFLKHWLSRESLGELLLWLQQKSNISALLSQEDCKQKLAILTVGKSHQMDLINALIKLGILKKINS